MSCSRPEAFPLVGLYGLLIWRRSEAGLLFVAAVLVAAPALWLIPGLDRGAGDPMHGSRVANVVLKAGPPQLERAALTPVPLAAAAVAGAVVAAWEHDRRFVEVAALVGVWSAALRLMFAAGYPPSSRFFFLPAGVLTVLGAAGTVRLVMLCPRVWLRAPVALAAAAVLAWSFAPRIDNSLETLRRGANRARTESHLSEAVKRAGRDQSSAAAGGPGCRAGRVGRGGGGPGASSARCATSAAPALSARAPLSCGSPAGTAAGRPPVERSR